MTMFKRRRHCEEQSDDAIQRARSKTWIASPVLAMTARLLQ